MIKIAICDDNREELTRTRSNCLAYLGNYPEQKSRISLFENPHDLIAHVELKEKFDIMLLDIFMPSITGIELATSLRERGETCEIIFLTSSESHAIEAFSLNATHYLVKPYTQEQFNIALEKGFAQFLKRKEAQITLKSSLGLHRVLFDDLLYAETQGHIQNVHLVGGKVLRVRITSIKLYEMLAQDSRFFKCGSTYIINMDKIREITARTVLLDSEEILYIPRRQNKPLIQQYSLFSLKGY